MGWLLSVVLSLPLVGGDTEVQMWFSKESYCTFAIDKFTEKPFVQRLPDGSEATGRIKSAKCRELKPDEEALVPAQLLWKVKPLGGLFDGN